MAISTKSVEGRRKVSYKSYDELLTDAERLASSDVRMLGNWSLAQIFKHLANAYNGSIDGISFKVPWPLRVTIGPLMKKKLIYQGIPAGFKIPKNSQSQFLPAEDTSLETALAELRAAVKRVQTEPQRAAHPLFGKLTRDEWDNFNLRHAEMHMSFAQPK